MNSHSTPDAFFSSSPLTSADFPRELKGSRALWRAVLLQALEDAASQSRKSKEQYYKTQALHWLTHPGADFMEVCDYAGLEPDYARRQIKKALSRGCKWRAEAGMGLKPRKKKAPKISVNHEAAIDNKTPLYGA